MTPDPKAETVDLHADDAELTTRMHTLFTDPQPQVLESLARAVGQAKAERFVPQLIELLAGAERLRTRSTAYSALKNISKQDFHHDASAWRTWWKHKNDPTKTPKDIRQITFARYFGGDVLSDRVVFVVDVLFAVAGSAVAAVGGWTLLRITSPSYAGTTTVAAAAPAKG